jgi:hypothetical protein
MTSIPYWGWLVFLFVYVIIAASIPVNYPASASRLPDSWLLYVRAFRRYRDYHFGE